MESRLVLLGVAALLIPKVTLSYVQPYTQNPYAVRDPRSVNPYMQSYQAYYQNYAPKVAQPTYQRPVEVTPARAIEYRQPSYQNTGYTVQRPVEYRPQTPALQSPMDYRTSYQTPAAIVSPGAQTVQYQPTYYTPTVQNAQPVEYHQPAYQTVAEFVTPNIQAVEYSSPVYQKAVEYTSPSLQSIEYQSPIHQETPVMIQSPDYQPVYQSVAEYVAQQTPVELQQSVSSDLTSTIQSQIPIVASTALDSIKSLGLQTSECTTTGTLDAKVLNNLAIALQLLIMNNIINNPKSDSVNNYSESLLELALPSELSVPNLYNFNGQNCQVPSAKFLGSSNFGDDSLMSKGMLGMNSPKPPSSRVGNLMSPYEAIAYESSSSPFSDAKASLISLKSNFQSPYAALMAADNNADLFTVSELF